MADLDSLEHLLAEALHCLNESAGLVREIEELETKSNLKLLGSAINSAWELRDIVHKLRPDLKPPFVVEYEENKIRYEQLSEISKKARAAEMSKDMDLASKLFQELRQAAKDGYFCILAEAGLYRLKEK